MKSLIYLILFTCCVKTFGQNKPSIDLVLKETIIKGIKADAYENTKPGFAHFFMVALSIDQGGKVDSIYLSRQLAPETKAAYALNSTLTLRMKSNNITFPQYASKLVVVPFFFYNADDNGISYSNGFLRHLSNVIPQDIFKQPIELLNPVIEANLPRQRKNDR